MSAKWLFFLLFVVFFGANTIGLVYFSKNKPFEDTKTVWLYEMPKTPAPWDGQISLQFGPAQALTGTLTAPGADRLDPSLYLAEKFELSTNGVQVKLRDGLTYGNGEKILAKHFVESRDRLLQEVQKLGYGLQDLPLSIRPYFAAKLEAPSDLDLQIRWVIPANDPYMTLAQPWTGVIHASNFLDGLKVAEPKKWISSGAYKIRKWRPKETVLFSRDDFVPGLPKTLFRTLKFLTAGVKNPSAHVMPASIDEALIDNAFLARKRPYGFIQVLWLCRSWHQKGSYCENIDGALVPKADVRANVRVADGIEKFRREFKDNLKSTWEKAGQGGQIHELSAFFTKPEESDIELSFVQTASNAVDEAVFYAGFSSRLRDAAGNLPTKDRVSKVFGLVTNYPADVQMKEMTGDPFVKIVLAQ